MTQSNSSMGISLESLLPQEQLSNVVGSIAVQSIAIDSRFVEQGGLFIACPGLQVDGRNYIDQAIQSGAIAIAAEAKDFDGEAYTVPIILVEGLAQQVSVIADRFYGEPSSRMNVVGFTGTNGKTTCSQILAQLYQLLGESTGIIGTLGYGVFGQSLVETGMTTPDAVQTQRILAELQAGGAQNIAMEVSSHSLDQGRAAAVNFSAAVFTNLSRDHLDYHGTLENYSQAKAKLFGFKSLKLAVVNGDDAVAQQMLSAALPGVACYQFSLTNSNADIFADSIVVSDRGIGAYIKTPWGEANLQTALLGQFNLSNLLAVIGVICWQGFSLSDVLAAVAKLAPVDGRMQVVSVDAGSNISELSNTLPSVVVDFAHTPDALEKALVTMSELTQGKLWCVFGCGGERDQGKRPEMSKVACQFADHVVVTSDNPRSENPKEIIADIMQGFEDQTDVQTLADRQQAIQYAITQASTNDCVLIAGKGHEQYQDINGTKFPFCDVREARLALRQRLKGGSND